MILYSTHCPKCKVIEMKLGQKGIEYELVDDKDAVIKHGESVGILSAPILEVDGKNYNFTEANKYINSL